MMCQEDDVSQHMYRVASSAEMYSPLKPELLKKILRPVEILEVLNAQYP